MAHIQILPKLVTSTFTPLNDLLMELQKENPSNCADLVLKLRDATRRDVSLENNSAEYCRARRLASIIMDIIKSLGHDGDNINKIYCRSLSFYFINFLNIMKL